MNTNNPFLALIACVVLCLGLGWLSGLVTEYSVATWYPTLVKPTWNPPNWVFPIAWTILYTMMGVALWFVWKDDAQNKTAAYTAFGIQLFLNFIWSFLFFYLQSPLLGFIDIVLLWVAIIATIAAFSKHSKIAAYLLIPYLLWVSYAMSLNWFIFIKNP